MLRNLSVAERRHEILEQVALAGRVAVADLSERFSVSEVTIRGDLQVLADGNLLLRTHGGAIPASPSLQVLSLPLRRQQQMMEKSLIGQAAASMIVDGDAVVLDSSSTALAIAQHLKERRYLTVVTNSLMVAQELLDAAGIHVVLPGGSLRRDTASVVSAEGVDQLRRFNLQKGFFGAHGITLLEGLTDVSADEAEVKRPLVALCREVVAVVDATKWGRVGLASFASLSQLDTIITDVHAPQDLVAQVRAAGVRVFMV